MIAIERRNAFNRNLSILVTLLAPVVLTLSVVRLLINPLYLVVMYNTPGFPADRYGFTKEERLEYGRYAVDYLVNDSGIEYLADLRFPDGQQAPPESCQFMQDCTRLYNERELQHMVDVKFVVQGARWVWITSLSVLAVLGIWAWRGGWMDDYRWGLGRGGWLTVWLLLGIIVFALAAFGVIFVWFHQIFFESGTWMFLWSDTLIRLFPERFWRDTFIVIGLLAGGAGLALGLLLRKH
jgi:integral membrane protein (TIGR01906 family)